jgi:hypothetical protein
MPRAAPKERFVLDRFHRDLSNAIDKKRDTARSKAIRLPVETLVFTIKGSGHQRWEDPFFAHKLQILL